MHTQKGRGGAEGAVVQASITPINAEEADVNIERARAQDRERELNRERLEAAAEKERLEEERRKELKRLM